MKVLAAFAGLFWGLAGFAGDTASRKDHIELEATIISGNQELPKVLYIVPWQDPSHLPTARMDPDVMAPNTACFLASLLVVSNF